MSNASLLVTSRGSLFCPWSAQRRAERRLISEFEAELDRIAAALTPERFEAAVNLARLPQEIRGFGYIKEEAMERAAEKRRALEEEFRRPEARMAAE